MNDAGAVQVRADPLLAGRHLVALKQAIILSPSQGDATKKLFDINGLKFKQSEQVYSLESQQVSAPSICDINEVRAVTAVPSSTPGRESVLVISKKADDAIARLQFLSTTIEQGLIVWDRIDEIPVAPKSELLPIDHLPALSIVQSGNQQADNAQAADRLLLLECEPGHDNLPPSNKIVLVDNSRRQIIGKISLTLSDGVLLRRGVVLVNALKPVVILIGADGSGGMVAVALPPDTLVSQAIPERLSPECVTISEKNVDFDSVEVTSGRLRAGQSDDQFVMTYIGENGITKVTALNLDDKGKPAILSSVALQSFPGRADPFPRPDRKLTRVATADFDDDGTDEIVVAWPATFGQYEACAAISILKLIKQDNAERLEWKAHHICAAKKEQPLTNIDLRIEAGVFRSGASAASSLVRGILVVGAAVSIVGLGENKGSVFAGVIGVNPNTLELPPYSNAPGELQGIVSVCSTDPDATRIHAVTVDLEGQSVFLGSPSVVSLGSRRELLAIICAPPFEWDRQPDNKPMLQFSEHANQTSGMTVSAHKSWTTTSDLSANLGVDQLHLIQHMNNTYGKNFDHVTDTAEQTSVTFSQSVSLNDYVSTISIDYLAWEYPVYKSMKDTKAIGKMLVLEPVSALEIHSVQPASGPEFGYRPRHEIGCILSYNDGEMEGYDGQRSEVIFVPQELSVSDDTGGASITYDRTKMNTETRGKTFTLHDTLSTSANLAASTDMFGYLPLSFGLGLSTSESYGNTDVETSHWASIESTTIHIFGGSVHDPDFDYSITPNVYRHKNLGCLVVDYKIDLSGPGWKKAFAMGLPMLIRPFRSTGVKDTLLCHFSRSISFGDQGKVIDVEVFNRSLQSTCTASCECFSGLPVLGADGMNAPTTGAIGDKQNLTIKPQQRGKFVFPWTPPGNPDGDFVTVKVTGGGWPPPWGGDIGWNVYPETQYQFLKNL